MTHPIGSPYVRDQISQRAVMLNEKRLQPEGEYVLYWMQSTHDAIWNAGQRERLETGRMHNVVRCCGGSR